jgi:Domain of unknown function (DUF5658)
VSAVTLAAQAPCVAGGYNDPCRGTENPEHEQQMSSHHLNGEAAATAPPAATDRRREERRQRTVRALVHGSFKPRRHGPRRAGERTMSAVDWHHPQWLAIAVLIVVFSCSDALLTLMLVERGADEWNPLMARLLQGSGLAFALIKIGLTAAGVVFLTQLARLRAFGGVPVGLLLYTALVGYVVLIVYELRLLNAL